MATKKTPPKNEKVVTKATPPPLYTYRNGEKIPLTKRPDQFVVRAGADELPGVDILDEELVSPHSMRITTSAAALDEAMTDARVVAPTHHAYDMADTGQEFLITDRVLRVYVSIDRSHGDESGEAGGGVNRE
jgi:hypothetical protein